MFAGNAFTLWILKGKFDSDRVSFWEYRQKIADEMRW